MEVGKNYIFYNSYLEKYFIGKYIDFNEKTGVYSFDVNGDIRLGSNVHDEVNSYCNSVNFIEYTAKKFQDKFQTNASVLHEDYEFKVYIPHNHSRILDDVEELMNDILEDWWSVQWCELENNNIKVDRNNVIVKFRLHDVHETEMRFNDGNK